MRTNLLAKLGIAACLLLGTASATDTAAACGSMVRRIAVDRKLVAKAEQHLRRGSNQAAANLLSKEIGNPTFRHLRRSALGMRAVKATAQAIVRTRGNIVLTRGPKTKTKAQRQKMVRWAVGVLAQRTKKRRKSPASLTDYAEALSMSPKTAPQAKVILEKLDGKHIITSAFGYLALARLRRGSGDAAGMRAALQRCRKMAAAPRVCLLPKVKAGRGTV